MSDMKGVRERTLATNGVELHLLEAGEPSSKPPVVLAHGFPELAYSWRHQLPALAAAGYHVVAPDQRGYGRSSRPGKLEDYDIEHLSGDLLGILDDLGRDKAVFVGHDWGSLVVWQLALLAPERVAGVVGMSVPFLHRAPMPPVELMRMAFGDAFFYIVYFQEPGVADADLGKDAATTMRRLLTSVRMSEGDSDDASDEGAVGPGDMAANDGRGFVDRLPEPAGLPDWLSQEELDHYIEEFSRTGFTGGINWYRNMDRNWRLTEHVKDDKVQMPSLFIGGALDPVLLMSSPANAHDWLSDHRGDVLIDHAGHWVQQEKADEVNKALLDFLDQAVS